MKIAVLTNTKVIGDKIEMTYWIGSQKRVTTDFTRETMTVYARQAVAALIKAGKINPRPSIVVDIDKF